MSICLQNCCTDRLPDMMPGEVMPVHADLNDWLEGVGSRQVANATWSLLSKDRDSASDLVITAGIIDNGDRIVSATVSGGDAGVLYSIQLEVVTCEGYVGKHCVQQFIRNC